jgi:glycosyltransferase involved in cell wall biosynthesis
MKNPKISIVTPSFNCGKYIEQAILSVLKQNYKNFEYIVIDGGSTDSTLSILKEYSKKYPKKFKYISEPDQGQTDAINKGLHISTGDWFIWLNADDYYEPNILSKLAKFLKSSNNYGVVYGNCFTIKGNKKTLSIPPKKVNFYSQKNGCVIYGPTSFFNMKKLRQVGEFDESLFLWMDYEMYIRLSKISRFKYINLNIANFRLRPDQKSRSPKNKRLLEEERDKIIKKYYPSYSLILPLRKRLTKWKMKIGHLLK